MIYVTGDMHGDLDCFKSRAFGKLKRKDTLIVCGDFGFLWDGSDQEKKTLRWLGKRKYQILFLEGAHDNLSLLDEYPLTPWNGGQVREISGKLKHLSRGSVFEIEGKKIFVFGGGESSSADANTNMDAQWWDKQLPTPEEIQTARENLECVDFKVDYVITHQGSRKLKRLMTMEDNEASVLDVFLDEVREKTEYIGWYFGSYHQDKVIPPNDMAVFEEIVPFTPTFHLDYLGKNKKRRKK